MFMIVTFPWPVPSANIEPDAPGRKVKRAHATTHTAATERNLPRRTRINSHARRNNGKES